jgi:serine/threonine-protein kinase HipA
LPEGEAPTHVFEIAAAPVTALQVEQHLRTATSTPSPTDETPEDFRISIAGAQEKTAFLWHQGKWCRPHGATPTTHIMKLALGMIGGQQLDMRLSLENEWLCCQLLSEFGLPVAVCELKKFGSTQTLVVTRFDRQLHSSGRYWLRLPQEDFCQATGMPSSLKYESDGGPGILEIARILQGSDSRDSDLEVLLRAQLLFWMLAATDGHAKNFSLRLLAEGRYRLTPLYDVISAWPIVGTSRNQVHPKKVKLAMALRGTNKHYRIGEITRQHFNATARQCGLGSDMEPIIADVIEKTPLVIERVGARLPKGFPVDLFETVTRGLQRAAFSLDRTKAT